MTTFIDPFGVGLLLGILVGAPIFASSRIAIGVLGSAAAGVMSFVIINGLEAFQHALGAFVKALGSDIRLTVGLLLGIMIVGVLSIVYRVQSNPK
jgi:hypothetical protein